MVVRGSAIGIRALGVVATLLASVGCAENASPGDAKSSGGTPGGGTASTQSSATTAERGGATGTAAANSKTSAAPSGGKSSRSSDSATQRNEGGSTNRGGSSASANGGRSSAVGGSSARPMGGDGGSGTRTSSGSASGGATSATQGTTTVGGSGGASTRTEANAEVTLVPDPSWTCGMPNGIPLPTRGKLVLQATLEIDKSYDVGTTQYGKRRFHTVKSGSLKGDKLQATVLAGGLEFELTLSNDSVEFEQIHMLRTSDNTVIYMRNCGVAASSNSEIRVVPDFEVANSSTHAWLNTGKFAGTRAIDAASGKIQLDIYDISDVDVAEPKLELKDPEGVPQQSWECSTDTGSNGATAFSETVALGGSLSVGASKRGTRNVIPITGGTVTPGTALSNLSGSVVPGGADYQLTASGSSMKLDARYALESKDGEFIVVRNCGPMGALVPVFEARTDGAYAVLNTKKYLSANPAMSGNGVGITFYERK